MKSSIEIKAENLRSIQRALEEAKEAHPKIKWDEVQQSKKALLSVPLKILKAYPEIVWNAVKEDRILYEEVPWEIRVDCPEITWLNINSWLTINPLEFIYIDCDDIPKKTFADHPLIYMFAVKGHRDTLRCISQKEEDHPDIFMDAIQEKPTRFVYIPRHLLATYPKIYWIAATKLRECDEIVVSASLRECLREIEKAHPEFEWPAFSPNCQIYCTS